MMEQFFLQIWRKHAREGSKRDGGRFQRGRVQNANEYVQGRDRKKVNKLICSVQSSIKRLIGAVFESGISLARDFQATRTTL